MTKKTLDRANHIKEELNDRWTNIEHLDELKRCMNIYDDELDLWTICKTNKKANLLIAPSEFQVLYEYELDKIDKLNKEFNDL